MTDRQETKGPQGKSKEVVAPASRPMSRQYSGTGDMAQGLGAWLRDWGRGSGREPLPYKFEILLLLPDTKQNKKPERVVV